MCVLAMGNFDGVHVGHQALLAVGHEVARRENLPFKVLTFEPHPREVLTGQPVPRLMSLDEKKAALLAWDVDDVVVQTFDKAFAALSPQAFMADVLVAQLGVQHVVVGENFRFGHKAAGDVALLKAQKKFTTHAVHLVTDAGGVVSSSRLRRESS